MVNVIDCGYNEFLKQIYGKKVFGFGVGRHLESFLQELPELSLAGIIDNYKSKESGRIYVRNEYRQILSLKDFIDGYDEKNTIIITCLAFEEILKQLDQIEKLDGMSCYISSFLMGYTENRKIGIYNCGKQLIPKKIHYCWFGEKELPKEYLENIKTWEKYCPDYEIIRWDESNYDFCKNNFISQAAACKKWAFVSDYARVDILFQEGGIYLDTDIKMLKNLDEFLRCKLFCGFESRSQVNWGLGIGAMQGHEILKNIMDIYDGLSFIQKDGTLNETPCPKYQSAVLKQYGFQMNGEFQEKEGVVLYPKEFFSPFGYLRGLGRVTDNSYMIHEYSASWQNREKAERRKLLEESLGRVIQRTKNNCHS